MQEAAEIPVGATELARAFAGAETESAAREAVRRWCAAAPPPTSRRTAARACDTVGIWRHDRAAGEGFVRDRNLGNPALWADVPRIAPRSARPRVVLIGESCARAWPLDPLLNCAQIMRLELDAVPGGEDVEIIDLARAGLLPADLVRLVEEASVLQPDVYVIFAGNNWHIHPDALDSEELAATLRARGEWAAVVPHFDRVIRERVGGVLTAVGEACARSGSQTLFVLPGENLRDRFYNPGLCNPLLTARDRRRRAEWLSEVEARLEAGDVDRAADVSGQIIELEGGISIAGWRARGRCALARGDLADAHHDLMEARESACYLVEYDWIHSYTVRLDECRRRGAGLFSRLVDLPRELSDAEGGGPPGRAMFLDQCHLNARGVRFAMATTVSALLPLIGLSPRPPDERVVVQTDVERRAEAQAHVVAAVISGHDEDLRTYHCRQALAASPHAADLMKSIARASIRRVPLAMADELPDLHRLAATFPAIRHLARSRPYSSAAAHLACTVAHCLSATDPDLGAAFDDLLRRHHSIARRPLDLFAYESRCDMPTHVPRGDGGILRARGTRQDFIVVGDVDPDTPSLRLEWTSRHCQPAAAGRLARLLIDGLEVHRWPMSSTWTTQRCLIASDVFSRLLHTITIQWPEVDDSPGERCLTVVDTLQRGRRARDGRLQYYGDRGFEFLDALAGPGAELHAFTTTPIVS